MNFSTIWHERKHFLMNTYQDFEPEPSGRQILLSKRISKDGRKIIVRTSPEHFFFVPPYLGAMILDYRHALRLKLCHVSELQHDYGGKAFCEVLLCLDYWSPIECGPFDNFDEAPQSVDFASWRKTAATQQKAGILPEAWEYPKEFTSWYYPKLKT